MDERDEKLKRALSKVLGSDYQFVGDWLNDELNRSFVHRPEGSKVERYAVHHSAARPGMTTREIAQFHAHRLGWSTYGYHFTISSEGRVDQLIPVSQMSYGAGPHWNPTTAHICCIGNWHEFQPTYTLLSTLYKVLCTLDDSDFGYLPWKSHRELRPTACPGQHLVPHVERMRGPEFGANPKRPTAYPY